MNGWKDYRDEIHREQSAEPEAIVSYELCGANSLAFAARAYEKKSCLLGERYLTRRSGMFLVAPSGQGKSTAVMQAMICWACGRPAFEIQTLDPLRIDLIQAEDDDGDLSEMARLNEYLFLTTSERELIEQNTWIETVNDKIGPKAIQIIDQILSKRPCDLLILNPYTAYLPGSIMDDEANSAFLRADLQRLANKHNCALLIVHHTPKTNFRGSTKSWSIMDWMYSGAGAAVLTNWARAILAIDPLGASGVFRFIAAKRGARIGWEEPINYFRHDVRPGVLLWSKASPSEVASAKKNGSSHPGAVSSQTVIESVPVLDGISMTRLREVLETKGASQRGAKIAIDLAIEDHLIHAIQTKGQGQASRIKMIYRGNEDLLA